MILNRLHTREKLTDRLHGLLFHGDKEAPKLILVREANSSIVTTQEIVNIISVVIATKSILNGRHNRVVEPSDDLVIFAILVFKTIREICFVFILRTNMRLDITCDITPSKMAFEEAAYVLDPQNIVVPIKNSDNSLGKLCVIH